MKPKITVLLFLLLFLLPLLIQAEQKVLIDFSRLPGFQDWQVSIYPTENRSPDFLLQKGGNPSREAHFWGEALGNKEFLNLRTPFPEGDRDSSLLIRIPESREPGEGFVENVGILKTIDITLYSADAPAGISLLMRNERGEERVYDLGTLDFEGWRQISWNNPTYIKEIMGRELKHREEPPSQLPFCQLVGIIITNKIGDQEFFNAFFKKMQYDLLLGDPNITEASFARKLKELDKEALLRSIYRERFVFALYRINLIYDWAVLPPY